MRILYHDDFDGMASAALMSAHLMQSGFFDGSGSPTFAAVDYNAVLELDWKHKWPAIAGGDLFAVVDFKYHPSALFWADHHSTAFASSQDESHFRAQQLAHPSRFLWGPTTSCATLLYSCYPQMERYTEIVAAADLIDTASFASPAAYFAAEQPATALSMAHYTLSEGQKAEVIRRMASSGTVTAALQSANEQVAVAVKRECELRNRSAYHMTYDSGVVVVDVIDQGLPFVKFAPYYYFPEARYAITLYTSGWDVRVSLGKNPWITFPHHDLASLARRVGGGGHPFAAGALFQRAAHAAPEGAARAFVHHITRELTEIIDAA